MAQDRGTYRIVVAIVVGMIVLSLSISTGRERKGYEVEAQVYGVPAAQSDAARAIGAYERLMERHMDLTERSFAGFTADLKVLATKFDSFDAKVSALDAKLTQIDQRLARIEKHMGIATVVAPKPAKADPNTPAASKAPPLNSVLPLK
jgi:septal ring factor EnvC (AmiA/AmiB activator)